MEDLYLGLVILTTLALAVFLAVVQAARRLSPRMQSLLGLAIVVAMGIYGRCLWHNPLLADWLPFSNLVIVGNWFPVFLAALAGLVFEVAVLQWYRRAALIASLLLFALYAATMPLLGEAPDCGQRNTALGDCVQTTDFTCSAASAVTLLRRHGIEATEQEMAELCLTRSGTSWLGLYRGLKRKTLGTRWDVEVVRCSADELHLHADRPMILEVGLESSAPIDAAFREEFGWRPGLKHSVVLSGFVADRAAIIDPAPLIGREEWDRETLELLWRGVGLRLVERPELSQQFARGATAIRR